MRPECLACIEPGPQAPHPVPPSRTPHENTPQKDEVDGSLFGLRGVWIDSTPIRHGRACPGHPRLQLPRGNSWMPGTSAGHDGDNFGEYRILCVPGNALVSPRGTGVTTTGFQALRVREDWPEVNFWAPSGTNFRALFQERGRVASGSEELADSHTDAQDLFDEQR